MKGIVCCWFVAVALLSQAGDLPRIAAAEQKEALSAPVRIDANPDGSLLWRTVRGDAVRLWWENPTLATSARLTFAGIKRTTSVPLAKGVNEYLWNLPAPAAEKDEDVYTVCLEFLNGDAVLVGETLTAKGVGRVRGVGRDATTRVYGDGTANRRWKNCPSGKAVIPVWDASANELRVNGEPVELPTVPGWYGRVVPTEAPTALSLTTASGVVEAMVRGLAECLAVIIR